MEARSHEVIKAPGREIPVSGGRVITVKPVKLGQLPEFVEAIRPAFGALVALVPAASSPGDTGSQGAEPSAPFIGNVADAAAEVDAVEMLDLIGKHGPALYRAMAIVTGEPVETIEDLDLEEGAKVLTALWEVNRDFFIQRVLPLLARG